MSVAMAERGGRLVLDTRGAKNTETELWVAAGKVAAANLGLDFVEAKITAPECYTEADFE